MLRPLTDDRAKLIGGAVGEFAQSIFLFTPAGS